MIKNVHISTNVQIHTGKLVLDFHPKMHTKEKIKIDDNVWIAFSTVISAGFHIGENSIIDANSVVNKNVEKNSFYAGNPAKFIRRIN